MKYDELMTNLDREVGDFSNNTTNNFVDVMWDELTDGKTSLADCLYDYAAKTFGDDTDAVEAEVERVLDLFDYNGAYFYVAHMYIYDNYEEDDVFDDDLFSDMYEASWYWHCNGSTGLNTIFALVDKAYKGKEENKMDKKVEVLNLVETMAERLDWVCEDFIKGIDEIKDVPMNVRVACSELATVIETLKQIFDNKDVKYNWEASDHDYLSMTKEGM